MEQGIFNFYSLLLQIVTAIAAAIFVIWQIKINERMKKLQDYVAISVVPMGPGNSSIKVMNVGKINLYLKRYEIGTNTETFTNTLLIPAGTGENSNLRITPKNLQEVMQMKFYLIDELGEKYIFSGQIIIDQLTVPILQRSVPQEGGTAAPQSVPSVAVSDFKIWSFKTEKYNWMI